MGLNAIQQELNRVQRQYLVRLRNLLTEQPEHEETEEDIATGVLLGHIHEYLTKQSAQHLTGTEALLLAKLYRAHAQLSELRVLGEGLRSGTPDALARSLKAHLCEVVR